MGQETTSTYTVVVTHSGPKKDFFSLFRRKGTIKKVIKSKLNSFKTKKTPTISKYSDEQKMTRMLFKKICDDAGLEYSKTAKDNYYDLNYGYPIVKGGKTTFIVSLCHARIELYFPNGVGATGSARVYGALPNQTASRIHYNYWHGKSITETFALHIADPNCETELKALFRKWGTGTAPVSK